MKIGFLAAAATLALTTQSVSAQPIRLQPSSGSFTFGGTITRPGGVSLGGYYSNGPTYYAPPIYAAPVLIPVRPVVPVGPVFGPPVSVRPYYGSPYYHHNHGYRW
jgi:hypothetical protein